MWVDVFQLDGWWQILAESEHLTPRTPACTHAHLGRLTDSSCPCVFSAVAYSKGIIGIEDRVSPSGRSPLVNLPQGPEVDTLGFWKWLGY